MSSPIPVATPLLLVLAWPGLCPLCPGLSPMGEVYMSRERALSRAFPKAVKFQERRHLLGDRERKRLEDALGRRLPERGYLCYLALAEDGSVLGLSLLTAEVGRTEPFFLMVSMSPEGLVAHIDVIEYREPRGMEVRGRGYLARFAGLSRTDAARRLPRLPVIPGATLSCHAVCRGVAKALELHALYLDSTKGKDAVTRLQAVFAGSQVRIVRPDPEPREPEPRKEERKEPPKPEREDSRAAMAIPAMGDLLGLELFEAADPDRLARALAEAASLERELSAFRPDSLIGTANRLPIGGGLDLRAWPRAATALRSAFRAAHASGGRFSPVPSIPDPEWSFRLDEARLWRVGPGELDAGGFGKGLAADLLVEACGRLGLSWRYAGFRSSFRYRSAGGAQGAVAVSGTGRRGNHIVDPRTGTRPRGVEVIVLAGTAFEAEWRSKPAFLDRDREASAT